MKLDLFLKIWRSVDRALSSISWLQHTLSTGPCSPDASPSLAAPSSPHAVATRADSSQASMTPPWSPAASHKSTQITCSWVDPDWFRGYTFSQGWASVLFKRTQRSRFLLLYFQKNEMFLRSFAFFIKRTLDSLRSFTFVIKERCVLCVHIRSL